MPTKKKIPEIRFKGFEGEWEEKRLGDLGETFVGLSGKTKEDFGHGMGRFITYMNVFSNTITNPNDVDLIEMDSSQKMVQKGDVFFTTSSETPDEVGMSSVLMHDCNNTYLNSFCFGFRPIYDINKLYLAYMLRSAKTRKRITFLAQGISRYNISKNRVMDILVSIPEIHEQSKIGSFFQNLDSLISDHQRRYDKLTAVKKSMLEKMFPKDGADVPEIRFKGFTGKWERIRLGELCESLEYGLNAAAVEYDGVNKYLRITDIDDMSHRFNLCDITSPDTDINLSDKYLLYTGDLVFARTGASVGKTYIYEESDGKVYFAGFLIRARILSDINSYFVFINTLTKTYRNFVDLTSQRSGQPGINAQEYSQYEFYLPKYDEQSKIASFFQQLDSLIALQKREIEKLKAVKRACLERMFI